LFFLKLNLSRNIHSSHLAVRDWAKNRTAKVKHFF
jgi:hypothetical protein